MQCETCSCVGFRLKSSYRDMISNAIHCDICYQYCGAYLGVKSDREFRYADACVASVNPRCEHASAYVLTSVEAKSPWSGAETDIIEGGGN